MRREGSCARCHRRSRLRKCGRRRSASSTRPACSSLMCHCQRLRFIHLYRFGISLNFYCDCAKILLWQVAIYSFEKYDDTYLLTGLRNSLGIENVKTLNFALSADTVQFASGSVILFVMARLICIDIVSAPTGILS